jgi:hypothetical protein
LVDELVERVLPVGAWQKFSQVSALVCYYGRNSLKSVPWCAYYIKAL